MYIIISYRDRYVELFAWREKVLFIIPLKVNWTQKSI